MVSRREKLRSTQFICDKLESSGLYVIKRQEPQRVVVVEKADVREQPRTMDVVMANFLGAAKNFLPEFMSNRKSGIYTSPVLYKDGETAFVRMVETNRSWRDEKSLKEYSKRQINQMLHLRKIEKEVMEQFGYQLVYYQPQTERLEESLRKFRFEEVELDYSHINEWDDAYGFVENRLSIDYKIPHEICTINPSAKFSFKHNRTAHLISAETVSTERELTELAESYFPGLEGEEAIKTFSPDD